MLKFILLQFSSQLSLVFKNSRGYKQGEFSRYSFSENKECKRIFKKNFDMNLEDFYHNAALAINSEKVVDIEQMKNKLKQIKGCIKLYSQNNNINYDDLLSNYYFEFKKDKNVK